MSRDATPQIFISYRRDDAAGHAGRLYDQLREDFGDSHVFMDVDAIDPGADFVDRIESAVASADVFVAVVGRGWVTATDAGGRRRLENPNDYVRHEVAAALRREITFIPVLVGGATMPSADDLPDELKAITRRNALVISDLEWRSGIQKLAATIEKKLRSRSPEPVPTPYPRRPDADRDQVADEDRDEAEAVVTADEKAAPAAVVLGLAGAALLVAATALRWDTLVQPDFGRGTVPYVGWVTAPASVAVAAGAVYALLLAWRGGPDPLATGLLLGFSIGGVAKYGALLGRHTTASERQEDLGPPASLVLGLAGAAVLAALATFWIVTRHRQSVLPSRVVGRVFVPIGTLLFFAATLIPFNVSFPESRNVEQVILRRDVWEAIEPIVIAAALVFAVLAARTTKQLVVSGAFIALGLLGVLFWIRYIGVPLLQMLDRDDLASVRAGGFVGLAGAALVWRAGIVGRNRVLEHEHGADGARLAGSQTRRRREERPAAR